MSLSKPAKHPSSANPNEILVNVYCKRILLIHIPSDIIQLCSLFYCGYQDKWDIQSLNGLQIDRNIIGHKLLNGHYLYSTWTELSYGFGINGIKKGQIFTWNFRVLHFSRGGYSTPSYRDEAVIGIVEYDKNAFDGKSGYGLWLNTRYKRYHSRYYPHRHYEPNEYNQYSSMNLHGLSHDDIIEMTLDLRDKQELTVKIKYLGNYKLYTFSNIDCEDDKVYKMMLGIKGGYNILELNPTQYILDYHRQYIFKRFGDYYRESMECCKYYQDNRISMANRRWNQNEFGRKIENKGPPQKVGYNGNTWQETRKRDKEIRQYYQDQRISIW